MFEIMGKDLCRENILVEYLEGGALGKPPKRVSILLVLQYFPSFLNKAWDDAFLHFSSIRILIIKYLKRNIILNEYPYKQKESSILGSQDTLQRTSEVSFGLDLLSLGTISQICQHAKNTQKSSHCVCLLLFLPSNSSCRKCDTRL